MPPWVTGYLGGLVAAAALFRAATGPLRPPAFLGLLAIRVTAVLLVLSPLGVMLLWIALERGQASPTLLPAALAGAVVALGWLVTFILRQYETLEDRDQTRRDTLLALRQEVFTVLETLEKTNWAENAKTVQAKIANPPGGKTAFFSFSSTETRPIIFETVAQNLRFMDEVTVGAVVRFYAEFNALRGLIDDTKRQDFRELDAQRRELFHVHLTTQRRNTIFFALRAIYRINVVLGRDDPANIPRGLHGNAEIALDTDGLS